MEFNGWRDVHVGFEGDGLEIDGVRIWQTTWHPTGAEDVELPHPVYPNQRHSFSIFSAGVAPFVAHFAAGELSNGVWGFYVRAE